jgi:hypothetical protein
LNHITLMGSVAWPLRWMAPVLDDVVQYVNPTRTAAVPTQSTSSP